MANEEKPFDPTPSRLQKARREGNVARSPEISGFASFAFGTLAIFAVGSVIGTVARTWIERAVANPDEPNPVLALLLAALVGAVFVTAGFGGVVANLVQTNGMTFTPLSFKLDRLNPSAGFKRLFSMQAAVSAIKALLAFGCALAIAIPTAELVFVRGTGTSSIGTLDALATIGAERALGSALLVAFVFAIADYLLVRKQWLKKLKMSLYELKKELQENEGDPHLRGRRKQRHRQMISGPIRSVAQAAFVVVNPTHVSVALQYAPPEIGVPMVLVMGIDDNALRIRTLANDLGIPLVENVALARSLWDTAAVGKPIPRETFVAVAEIVTALYNPSRARPQLRACPELVEG